MPYRDKSEDGEKRSPKLELEDNLSAVIIEKDESDDFNFESESYALQHNKDYQMLVKTLVKLEAQKIQAIKGLEELHEVRESVLKDPFAFVKALQSGENMNLPGPINIVEVPEIEWNKYDIHSIVQAFRPKTRRLTKENVTLEIGGNTEAANASSSDAKANSKAEKAKSDTFNVPWTLEEQRKLEELLIKYPHEPMASKRWTKIAKELGSRSLMQVQSRVQKYFIALKKEGLPVPGRDPKGVGRKRGPCQFQNSSTSKYMRAFDFESDVGNRRGRNNGEERERKEQDKMFESGDQPSMEEEDVSDEDDLLDELKDTKEYRELLHLKRAKKRKVEEAETGEVVHYGFKCDGCSINPIRGTRWHCADCPQSLSVDLCEGCAAQYQNEVHSSSHVLTPVRALCLREMCLRSPSQNEGVRSCGGLKKGVVD